MYSLFKGYWGLWGNSSPSASGLRTRGLVGHHATVTSFCKVALKRGSRLPGPSLYPQIAGYGPPKGVLRVQKRIEGGSRLTAADISVKDLLRALSACCHTPTVLECPRDPKRQGQCTSPLNDGRLSSRNAADRERLLRLLAQPCKNTHHKHLDKVSKSGGTFTSCPRTCTHRLRHRHRLDPPGVPKNPVPNMSPKIPDFSSQALRTALQHT